MSETQTSWQRYGKKWHSENKTRLRLLANDRYRINRRMVIDKLGAKCVRCGFSDVRALQLNHINGDGYVDRLAHGGSFRGGILLQILKDERHDIELLCANCNWIHRYEKGLYPGAGGNPHGMQPPIPKMKTGPKKGSHYAGWNPVESARRRKEYNRLYREKNKVKLAAVRREYYLKNKWRWGVRE